MFGNVKVKICKGSEESWKKALNQAPSCYFALFMINLARLRMTVAVNSVRHEADSILDTLCTIFP
jgi:hypothetical protein